MTTEFAKRHCIPCKEGVRPFNGEKLEKFQKQLNGNWKVVNEHHLEKEYGVSNFRQAFDFTRQVGELVEAQGHHPGIYPNVAKAGG